ncbi:ubiquinol-cytochrome c reductase complex assembly factor 2-like [Corticium candelabrum]|uniref:ubiquinol-cytochrome c reductase complex assembly factor 2-like n=1 Tax=Corticium candelabrum TaxID=121492 RepID=UPI002E25EBC0|nr:ubiquinol-cytochrome c reductase complex assembly factor 2-like [Corticium candelabrum]
MASTLQKLQRLSARWPVDKTKQGRDLGEYIRNQVNSLRESNSKDSKELERAYQALKLIHSNHFRNKYPRLKEIAFTGTLAKENPWLLSNETQDKMQRRTIWDRVLGRKKRF